ncbi:MAG TPA: hypothetical protein VIG24_13000 [Acidimicrobiia bacterium]
MGAMTDQEIVQKSLELEKLRAAMNLIMRELVFDGCRVDCDVTTTDYSSLRADNQVPMIEVDVYRRVAG